MHMRLGINYYISSLLKNHLAKILDDINIYQINIVFSVRKLAKPTFRQY